MNIVVLAGGISTERAVSIVSGTGVCRALRERGHRAILVDVYGGVEEFSSGEMFAEDYDVEAALDRIHSFDDKVGQMAAAGREFFGPGVLELCRAAEVVFLALHGAEGENGKVQAAFDLFGIRYTGTGYLSSALAMDKGLSRKLMEAAGVPMPKGVKLIKGTEANLAGLGLDCPVVVKPCCGGSSVGVNIARTREEYEAALLDAFSYEEEVIVEEYVQGREFSVGVVDGKALPVIEIAPINGFYDYKNKYSAGSTVETCPAPITDEQTAQMQRLAILGNDALGIRGYSRLDFLMGEDGRICCLEANTLPGMTPTSLIPQEAAAMGMGYGEFCEWLIQVSIR